MTPDDFKIVRSLFHEAFDLSEGDRETWLHRACAGKEHLRVEVEALLRASTQSSVGLEAGDGAILRQLLASADSQGDPKQLGPYTILRRIGHGGMGVVYLAQQSNPQREVALKVLRGGPGDGDLRRRFDREIRLLGRLQHPGIARVYEAGITDTSWGALPYFAMEYVHGRPLTEYAAARQLDVPARLELLARVCDAVHYAHTKGIIHRDLKPGNILVIEEDDGASPTNVGRQSEHKETEAAQFADSRVGRPELRAFPKVLDFGVARVLEAEASHTVYTQPGQLVGTLAYMSPEQAAGDSEAVDTRGDVYSLGVIMFELLTGQLPHAVRGKSPADAARMIRDEAPMSLHAAAASGRRCDRDLQTIVTKALEKQPSRRFASVAELAADIRRYLRDEPLLAHPPSSFYQLRKFARRNKVAIAAGFAMVALLIGGIIGTSMGLLRAQREAAIAQAVNEFLNGDLLASIEVGAKRHDYTVRELLDDAAKRIEGRVENQPAVEASIRLSLGRAYSYLAQFDIAAEHLERSISLARGAGGVEPDDYIQALLILANVRNEKDRPADAEPLLKEALAKAIRLEGESSWNALLIMNALAQTYRRTNRLGDAEALYKRVIEIRRSMGDDHDNQREILAATTNLATLYFVAARYDKAEPLMKEAHARAYELLGPDDPLTLKTVFDLGKLDRIHSRFSEAEARLVPVLPAMRRVVGENHPHTFFVMGELAALRRYQGRIEEAIALQRETLEGLKVALGPEHSNTLEAAKILADMEQRIDQTDLATPRENLPAAPPEER